MGQMNPFPNVPEIDAPEVDYHRNVLSFSEPERKLYTQMVIQAFQDVINGTDPNRLRQAAQGDYKGRMALRQAEDAMEWIMDDCDSGETKEHCKGQPCRFQEGAETNVCPNWRAGAVCQRITFREACLLQAPPLDPRSVRSALVNALKARGGSLPWVIPAA